jgi:inosine-uridine nucleoside N-ribohydrolase
MGGSVAGRGNFTAAAEFNAYGDPEAAHVVLSSLPAAKVTLVSWELCVQHALPWEQFDHVTS